MKIECKIRRPGGTHVPMPAAGGTIDYHFAPLADGAHVAEVANAEHAARFLSITEGYKRYGAAASPAAASIIARAVETPAVPTAATAATAPASTALQDNAPAEQVAEDDAVPLTLDQMDRPTVASVFEIVIGERAHHAAKIETLRARIEQTIEADPEAKARFDAEALRLGALVTE